MDRPALPAAAPFGDLLRHWRQQRGLTQLVLAAQAEVSTRHLSWLETGRSEPSRAMVLRLAEQLDVPLRERNAWLVAAGFAPLYRERALDDAALAPARAALQRLLDAHEPWPALAVNRHWEVMAHNAIVPLLLQAVDPALLQPPINLLRVSLHPQGLAGAIVGFAAWRHHVLHRLQRQAAATADPVLAALLRELQALPPTDDEGADVQPEVFDDVAVPLRLRTPTGVLSFITTVTVFGAPHDVTLSELAIETLLPTDAATADALRAMHAGLPR